MPAEPACGCDCSGCSSDSCGICSNDGTQADKDAYITVWEAQELDKIDNGGRVGGLRLAHLLCSAEVSKFEFLIFKP